MEISDYFPDWDKLTGDQQKRLRQAAAPRRVKKGEILHNGSMDCLGLVLLRSGQLRAYIVSDEGREITVYRLFERDVCLLSAACTIQSIQFEIIIEAEKDSEVWIIPPVVFKKLMEESASIANYTNQLMASRFSEAMWLIEQVMWKSFDKRLAGFLLEECLVEETSRLKLTHEKIANHVGSAREVVTRMLRYFQEERLVRLTRGSVEVLDAEGLARLRDS
jgi:CRP/FNR family transcriptional regulator